MKSLIENYTNAIAFLESLNNALGFVIFKSHEIEQGKIAVQNLNNSINNFKKNVDSLENNKDNNQEALFDNVDDCINEIVKNLEIIQNLVVVVGQRYMAYVDAEQVG